MVKVHTVCQPVEALATSCLVIPCLNTGLEQKALDIVRRHFPEWGKEVVASGEFRGEDGELCLLHNSGAMVQRLLLVGVGAPDQLTSRKVCRLLHKAAAHLVERRITEVAVCARGLQVMGYGCEQASRLLVEAIAAGAYQFRYYKQQGQKANGSFLETLTVLAPDDEHVAACSHGANQGAAVAEASYWARDLANQPGNIKSPAYVADQAMELARELGLPCRVLDDAQLADMGMGALLGVAQGSLRVPRLIFLEYNGGPENEAPIALVGKAVVFDAGGISLKPAEKMEEMKFDMAGGATVLGALAAAAKLQLPVNLVAAVPAVENMPSGLAQRPGDVVTSLSGKTIEVINTDAEGRLILADALTCVQRRYKPQEVIDVATLTGAVIIALGHQVSAVLGNNEDLVAALQEAGGGAGEALWPLPLYPEYQEALQSTIADLKNVGGRPAGTITAAAFLQNFVDAHRWAHLDIAGTAWTPGGEKGAGTHATGVGVSLLAHYLQNRQL